MNEDERSAQAFYEDLEGGRLGLLSAVARVVFDLSGYFYAGSFIRRARLRPSERVLEVGCGTASILIRAHGFRDSTRRYYGVDISHTMLERATHNIKRKHLEDSISIAAGPASSLPFKDESFSAVLFAYVIKHLSDETFVSALREANRVLVPGGRLVMWEFVPSSMGWANRYVYSVTRAVRLRNQEEIATFLEKTSFSRPEPFTILAPWMPTRTFAVVATK
ncbi:MAG: class I SAM-dependent methyltransferase [Candidatus Brocadiales bacterium]